MISFVYKTETKAIQPPEKPTKPEPTIAWPDYSGDLVVDLFPQNPKNWNRTIEQEFSSEICQIWQDLIKSSKISLIFLANFCHYDVDQTDYHQLKAQSNQSPRLATCWDIFHSISLGWVQVEPKPDPTWLMDNPIWNYIFYV